MKTWFKKAIMYAYINKFKMNAVVYLYNHSKFMYMTENFGSSS